MSLGPSLPWSLSFPPVLVDPLLLVLASAWGFGKFWGAVIVGVSFAPKRKCENKKLCQIGRAPAPMSKVLTLGKQYTRSTPHVSPKPMFPRNLIEEAHSIEKAARNGMARADHIVQATNTTRKMGGEGAQELACLRGNCGADEPTGSYEFGLSVGALWGRRGPRVGWVGN